MAQKPHVVIIPSPGMGHLIPLIEFAKKLVLLRGFLVTFVVPTSGPPPKAQRAILESLPDGINHKFLAPVSFEDFHDGIRAETQISLTVARSVDSIREVLKSFVSTTRLVALVVDLFGTDVFDIAREFELPCYINSLTTAMVLSFVLYLQDLDEMVPCEYRDLPEPLKVQGWPVPIHGMDLPDPVQDRKDKAYELFLYHSKRHRQADGILMNSFMELEPDVINALQEEGSGKPPIYPIGPLIQSGSSNSSADASGCLKWLDNQPTGSVLFVSFGSGGTLSSEQIIELALGLEMSKQKFLWVVRSPSNESASASYFSVESKNDPLGFMPKGFVDRTKEQGLVLPSWAPQIQILRHDSTGGFLTHCGWNSILESIVHGVPLIAWPLYAEQNMNAIMLTEGLKVALRPKAQENGIVPRMEIAQVVKSLMQGTEGVAVRERMNNLKDAAAKAVSEDGSSTKSFTEFVHKLNQRSI